MNVKIHFPARLPVVTGGESEFIIQQLEEGQEVMDYPFPIPNFGEQIFYRGRNGQVASIKREHNEKDELTVQIFCTDI